ncbi:MAG: UvrD-helicase domain-containing protein [Bacteroidales bacterium]|nr:UvrD-helicase domain-containing protein [Bacteroidales bacterium]
MNDTFTDLSSLNDMQKAAVISENKRLLVLAGAGSGKTKTLLQKLIYLIEQKHVNPSNILAITFTKNAVNEMTDRLIISTENGNAYANVLKDKHKLRHEIEYERFIYSRNIKWINKLTLKTFHSLCYGIMRNFGVSEFDNQFRVIADSQAATDQNTRHIAPETAYEIFHKILIKACESQAFLIGLKRYILDYFIDHVHLKSGPGSQNYPGKYYTSLNGTQVRSKSEQYIADWLFRHNIHFKYEPQVNFHDFDFKPDFYIPEANLYLEHVSDKSFPMHDKEQQFKIAGKLLVKTFETQTKNSAFFNLTLERIIKNRLPANYDFTVALSFEEEFKFYHKEIKDFLRQIMRVTDMIKVENEDTGKVLLKAQKDQHERIRDFYHLAIPIIDEYKNYATNKSYLDFNDMISRTISLFRNHTEIAEKFKKQYQYILVDEFQDVNNLQVELIKLLLTPKNQLFCVGDDWQSIYGFRGSNVDFIINFRKYFRNAEIIKLNMNYRSTENIVGASNEVIKFNKFKVDKELKSLKKANSKIHIFSGKDEDDCLDFVVEQIKMLQQQRNYSREDILFLYRRSKMFHPYFERFKQEGIFISGKTIHGAKGLEARAVFIIGLTEGYGGFPDIWMEDRIYQIIKPSKHDLLIEEERRLFYVAITRAKDDLYLITEKGNESSFLKEIPDQFTFRTSQPFKAVIDEIKQCSKCKHQLHSEYKFCPYCGSLQQADNYRD